MTSLNLQGIPFERYDILSELGRGGMGVVYLARQTELDRVVALKVLPPELTHDEKYVRRFRQEARSAARLEHPHIVPIYEVGELRVRANTSEAPPPNSLPPLHYIAMKYVEGQTLKEQMQHEGIFSPARAADLLAQVGEALDYAHQQGVIHRDIKPSNIMLTKNGWVYLTDFGLARGLETRDLTVSGTVLGTPEYMSPEQAEGASTIGPSTDIYALGIVLYEMLSGDLPFQADTPMALLAARLSQPPRPLREVRQDLPPPVDAVVMRALARGPEYRFWSAAEMVGALRQAAEVMSREDEKDTPATVRLSETPASTGPTIALPPTPESPPASAYHASWEKPPGQAKPEDSRKQERRTLLSWGVGGVLFILLITGVWVAGGMQTPPFPPDRTPVPTAVPTRSPVPGEVSLTEQGWDAFARGDYDEAEQRFLDALRLNPRSTGALNGLGLTLDYQSRHDEAVARFEESLRIREDQDVANNGLGWSLYNLEEHGKAEPHFRRAIALQPNYANAFYGLGLTLEELGRPGEAEEAYRRALALTNNDEERGEVRRALDRLSVKNQ